MQNIFAGHSLASHFIKKLRIYEHNKFVDHFMLNIFSFL